MSRLRRGGISIGLGLVLAFALGPEQRPVAASPAGEAPGLSVGTAALEQGLVDALLAVRGGDLAEALRRVREIVRERPDFALAQTVYADLLAGSTGSLESFAQGISSEAGESLQAEARARLGHYVTTPEPAAVPTAILRLPESSRRAVLVDTATYRLYVFENRGGRPYPLVDHYVSIGMGGSHKRREGDEKTPVGVYKVVSFIPDEELPDLYGAGAFPIDYPNPWDRALGRTGSGIWIHGTEYPKFSRPPRSSRGCVTLSNTDFLAVYPEIDVGGTRVVLADGVSWAEPATVESALAEVESAVESWRRDWESLDTDRYLTHYAADFRTPDMSRSAFAAHKRRVAAGRAWIRVTLEDVGVYAYPGEEDTVLVEFRQRYVSGGFSSDRRKQQFWRREADGWRIVFED